jgi:hypothetical protein
MFYWILSLNQCAIFKTLVVTGIMTYYFYCYCEILFIGNFCKGYVICPLLSEAVHIRVSIRTT